MVFIPKRGQYQTLNKPSVIEINGHRYDAVTGRLIGGMQKAAAGVGNIDGVFRAKTKAVRHHSKRSIHQLKRRTQHSQTLMRSVVKKPIIGRTSSTNPSLGHKPTRDLRTRLTGLHPKVSRHNTQYNHATTNSDASHEGEVISRGRSRSTALAISTPAPHISASASHQQLERLLDYALVRADAHKQSRRHHAKGPAKLLHILPKWLNIMILTLLVVAASGYIVWQKVPQASLKLASESAHVQAVIPSYVPIGYSISGPAKVENGTVTLKFTSSQKNSNLIIYSVKSGSEDKTSTIANNASSSAQVQSYQSNGVSVETIKDSAKVTAICNNNGNQISAQGDKNSDPSELAKMAASACSSN